MHPIDHRYCVLFYIASDIAVLQRILEEYKPDAARGRDDDRLCTAVNRFARHREHTMSPTVSTYLAKTADREHGLIHHAPDAGQRIINGRDAILRECLKRLTGIRFRAARHFKSCRPTSVTGRYRYRLWSRCFVLELSPLLSIVAEYYHEEYKFKRLLFKCQLRQV